MLLHDVRYAFRGLWRNQALALAGIACLALGIGVNTTIFSIIDGVLLKPYPYDDPDRIVVFEMRHASNGSADLSVLDLADLKAAATSVTTVAGSAWLAATLSDGTGEPERLVGAAVSWDLFRLLGAGPILGRDFVAADDVPNAPPVVLIGHSLWTVRYQADPGILGRSIRIDGAPHTVIGVMPPGFAFPEVQRLWVPMQSRHAKSTRDARFVFSFGRLAPGVTRERAESEFQTLGRRLASDYPKTNDGWSVGFRTLRQAFLPDDVPLMLGLMMAGATLVLFIACSNVANLLLTRAMDRRRELAVRVAAGAGRFRIVRQLLTEGVCLALLSVPPGLLLAVVGTRLFATLIPVDTIPYYIQWEVDGRSLGYTVAVAAITALVFGIVPALQTTRHALQENLKETTRGATSSGAWVRNGLVVLQVSLAVVALVGALLFVRSFRNLDTLDVGYRTSNALTLRVSMTGDAYRAPDAKVALMDDILRRIEGLPGVEAAFASDLIPLSGGGVWAEIDVEGRSGETGNRPWVAFAGATPSFHRVLGVRLVRGRDLTPADARQPFAVVNETLARRVWPGQDAIGRRLKVRAGDGQPEWLTVIGVAPDLWLWGAGPEDREPPPWVIAPLLRWATPNPGLTILTADDPSTVMSAARAAVRAADPGLPISGVRTLEDRRRERYWEYALFGWVFGSIGVFAALLAAIGVFGVVASSVAQRTREMGVRMALGAGRADVLRMVLREGLKLVGVGIIAGLVLALAGTPVARQFLYGVTPFDPASFIAVAVFLLAVGLLGSYVPARRATRVDPAIALRQE